jgi:succinyl-CoA synthetase beta subunit
MLLLEHDAKTLLAQRDIPVAAGVLLRAGDAIAGLPAGPWVVKAQIPAGGRGKAGGIRSADTRQEVEGHLSAMLGMSLKGHPVRGCRVEEKIVGGKEAYASLAVDPDSAGIRMLVSAVGGVDIESLAGEEGVIKSCICAPDMQSLELALPLLLDSCPEAMRPALRQALLRLGRAFFDLEALLIEINPLFMREDGSWIAGDAKMILDDNALARHPDLVAMTHERRDAYPETEFKLVEDFDYVELDTDGVVGLVTTGAGLSMMLVDQLADSGLSAFNFVDMRSGQMRGNPHRLVLILRRMREGRNIRVLLVNIFAGITHLGEFASLLLQALEQVPELRAMPIVARLVGNGLEDARQVLADANARVFLETDLEDALARVADLAGGRQA